MYSFVCGLKRNGHQGSNFSQGADERNEKHSSFFYQYFDLMLTVSALELSFSCPENCLQAKKQDQLHSFQRIFRKQVWKECSESMTSIAERERAIHSHIF